MARWRSVVFLLPTSLGMRGVMSVFPIDDFKEERGHPSHLSGKKQSTTHHVSKVNNQDQVLFARNTVTMYPHLEPTWELPNKLTLIRLRLREIYTSEISIVNF